MSTKSGEDKDQIGEAGEAPANEDGELRVDRSDKKTKLSFDANLGREEAVSYFEAIVAGLRSGTVQFRQGEESLVLEVGDQVEVSVKGQRKGDKGKITFELSWREGAAGLTIVPEA